MNSEVQLVSSMSSCDIAASTLGKIPVHFGAHPALTRAVVIGPGGANGYRDAKQLLQVISRHNLAEGVRLLDERDARKWSFK